MLYILNKPYPFLSTSLSEKIYKALATGFFVVLFLWLFDNKEQNSILLFVDNGIVVFVSQVLLLFIFHCMFAQQFFTHGIKLWQYIAGLAGGVLLGFTLMYLYVTPIYFKTVYSFGSYITYVKENLHFLFPITLYVIALDYIFVLKTRIREETMLGVAEACKENTHTDSKITQQDFVLLNSSGGTVFSTSKSNIFYIKSADNYIEIYYQSEGRIEKRLVRYLLSAVEADKNNGFLTRPHRSYLCNLKKVTGFSGGIQNCKLSLEYVQDSIPVAKTRARKIMRLVNSQLRGRV